MFLSDFRLQVEKAFIERAYEKAETKYLKLIIQLSLSFHFSLTFLLDL